VKRALIGQWSLTGVSSGGFYRDTPRASTNPCVCTHLYITTRIIVNDSEYQNTRVTFVTKLQL